MSYSFKIFAFLRLCLSFEKFPFLQYRHAGLDKPAPYLIRGHPVFSDTLWIPGRALLARNDEMEINRLFTGTSKLTRLVFFDTVGLRRLNQAWRR